MFTPTLRCECAQPGLIDIMRKWSIETVLLAVSNGDYTGFRNCDSTPANEADVGKIHFELC